MSLTLVSDEVNFRLVPLLPVSLEDQKLHRLKLPREHIWLHVGWYKKECKLSSLLLKSSWSKKGPLPE